MHNWLIFQYFRVRAHPESVSYTHLDVYKRQEEAPANYVPAAAVIRRVQALSGFIGRKELVGGLISRMSVSYTHLDVYKRQVPVWLIVLSDQLPVEALVSHYLTN